MRALRTHLSTLRLVLMALTLFSILLPYRIEFGTSRAQAPVDAVVSAELLNARNIPNGAVLGQYANGVTVSVQGREDNPDNNGLWVYVSDGSLTGWVLYDYLIFPSGFDVNTLPVITLDGNAAAVATDQSNQGSADSLAGTLAQASNFRSGAGTNYGIIRGLDAGTSVTITGRNADGTWLYGSINGQEGWLFRQLVRVSGDINALRVVNSEATTAPPTNPEQAPATEGETAPPPSYDGNGIISNITPRAREIYLRGLNLGNHPNVFAKVGDSITASEKFLRPIDLGGLHLEGYTWLQPVADQFRGSFGRQSYAALNNWTTHDVLNPATATKNPACAPDDMPLVCEYKAIRPTIALIMFGTNDVVWVDPEVFSVHLDILIQTSADMGVIPVLSTIPSKPGGSGGDKVDHFNRIIRDAANRNGTPLWDYYAAMAGLPNGGISPDGIHPSFNDVTGETAIFSDVELRYGYVMRNLTALMVLDAVWRGAMY